MRSRSMRGTPSLALRRASKRGIGRSWPQVAMLAASYARGGRTSTSTSPALASRLAWHAVLRYLPAPMSTWHIFADRVLAGGALGRDEARAVLDCSDDDLLGL